MEHQIDKGAVGARAGTSTTGIRAKHRLEAGKRAERPGMAAATAQGRRRGGAMTRLELPFPVPQRFTKGRGHAPTLPTQAYASEAAAAIARQRPAQLKGPVSVYVRLVAPDRGARDVGSLATSILDTLWAHGLIDGAVRRLTLEWAEHGPACVVLIQQNEVAA